MNKTERIPIVNEPKTDPIELRSAGMASTLFFVNPWMSKILSLMLILYLLR